jgi:hypothetical protein
VEVLKSMLSEVSRVRIGAEVSESSEKWTNNAETSGEGWLRSSPSAA